MTKVQVVGKIYTNPNTGEMVPYERLAIVGSINGDPYTLEIKLEKSELQLAKALLASDEDLSVSSRKATNKESEEFEKSNSGRTEDGKINIK